MDLPEPGAAQLAERLQALDPVRERTLLQLRVPLPLPDPGRHSVRPITPADHEEVVRVNNAAFAWHPEQGHMTVDDLRARMAEEWFDPADFLVRDADGHVGGFCWTRIHPPAGDQPALGEIHVIAVDPAHHGHGWGRSLTLAGMAHVHAAGVPMGMLWVEGDNTSALGLYGSLGFSEHSRRSALVLRPR
jgi:mycothiol synthase